MAKNSNIIGAGAGEEEIYCIGCAHLNQTGGKCVGSSELCGLSDEDFYREYRTTERGMNKESDLWRKIGQYVDERINPYLNTADDVVVGCAYITYKAGRLIKDFLNFKTRYFFQMRVTKEKVAERKWVNLTKQREYYSNVKIPNLRQLLKCDQEKLESAIEAMKQNKLGSKHYDEELDDYLSDKHRDFEENVMSRVEDIEMAEEHLMEIIEEMLELERNYVIGKHTQKDRVRQFKEQLVMKVFHPDNVGRWEEQNIADMMLGADTTYW